MLLKKCKLGWIERNSCRNKCLELLGLKKVTSTRVISKAFQRRRTNAITKPLNDRSCWQEGEACNHLIVNYFSDLCSSIGLRNQATILENMECKLTPDINNELIQPFTATEISHALKEMHPTKAPGPDGMPSLFFQKFWPHIGFSISKVLHILNMNEFPPNVNHTFITLIPKIKKPVES